MDPDLRFPAISDLRDRAKRRLPHFVWEYLDSATGDESAHHLNAKALDEVRLMPGVLTGPQEVDLTTRFLGRDCAMPVGIAPVGMSGLVWPDAEAHLARAAAAAQVPFCLSTVAAATPEEVGPLTGDMGWFQLYPPGDIEVRKDMLARARNAGFHTLVLTIDVAVASRRERLRRARITQPMKITPAIVAQCLWTPAWSLGMARRLTTQGIPKLVTLEKYADISASKPGTAHIGYLIRTVPDWAYVRWLRDHWGGALVLKGVMDPEPAARMLAEGVDALWVSNHGGRQFPGAPSALSALRAVRAAVGPEAPIIFDSGIRSSTDVLKAIGFGANLVMLGRAWHYAIAALGPAGPAHLAHILKDGLESDMGQLGITRPAEAAARVV